MLFDSLLDGDVKTTTDPVGNGKLESGKNGQIAEQFDSDSDLECLPSEKLGKKIKKKNGGGREDCVFRVDIDMFTMFTLNFRKVLRSPKV